MIITNQNHMVLAFTVASMDFCSECYSQVFLHQRNARNLSKILCQCCQTVWYVSKYLGRWNGGRTENSLVEHIQLFFKLQTVVIQNQTRLAPKN